MHQSNADPQRGELWLVEMKLRSGEEVDDFTHIPDVVEIIGDGFNDEGMIETKDIANDVGFEHYRDELICEVAKPHTTSSGGE